jgi:hypothetical protein
VGYSTILFDGGATTPLMLSELGHPEFLLNIVFMDIYFVPFKEGRRAKGAGQVPQRMCAPAGFLRRNLSLSNLLKQNFSAKQFA